MLQWICCWLWIRMSVIWVMLDRMFMLLLIRERTFVFLDRSPVILDRMW